MSNKEKSITTPSTCSIYEVAADLLIRPDFLSSLPAESLPAVKMVEQLLIGLAGGSVFAIEEVLASLGVRKENQLLTEVGHMARTLHDSLRDFKSSLNRDNLTMSTTNIPDATDKLESVLKLTFEAANKTMDNMECQTEIFLQLKKELSAYKLRLPPNQQSDSFLTRLEERISDLESISTETLVTQSFQDLTGQSIKKVITLVAKLEQNLISLVKVFGAKGDHSPDQVVKEECNTSRPSAEGGVKQDEVDDLLSSFGF